MNKQWAIVIIVYSNMSLLNKMDIIDIVFVRELCIDPKYTICGLWNTNHK